MAATAIDGLDVAAGKKLIRGARVLTMNAADEELDEADILIEGAKIRAIGRNIAASPQAEGADMIDARGLLAMPGLINAHFHSPANFMRGTLEGMPLELFMLYEVPPLGNKPPSKRLNYVRTMLGAMEMLKLGVTSVMDDAFYVPEPTEDAIDGLMQAYVDSGMRATATLDQPNIVEYEKYPYLADLLPARIKLRMDAATPTPANELLGLYDHLIRRWNGAAGGRIGAGVSCSAPQRVTVEYFAGLHELSGRHNLPFVVHVLETKLQRVLGQEKFGKSLVRYIHDLGLLDAHMQIVHAIWIDDSDMRLLAEAGCVVAHNPVCNLKLGSGIMPFRQLRDHGVPICLGSDEIIADDSANMWNVVKMTGLIHKITDPEYRNWPTAWEILGCLFAGGARAMRRTEGIGALAPGFEADIILVDLNALSFTPLNDLRRQLVYCENGSSVRMTMVAGEIVARNGRLLTVDEDALKQEARELMKEYRGDIDAAESAVRELYPYYRAMYLKAAKADVGMNRWASNA